MKVSVRSMVRAPKGKLLIAFDLSQAESWVVAHLANEPNMKRALKDGDIHTETAGSALFFPQVGCSHIWIKGDTKCQLCSREVTKVMRYVGKRYNHASSYRMGPIRAAQVINKDSDKPPYFTVTVAQSRVFSEAWHNYYNLKPWWDEIEYKLNTNNRTLVTVYRRERSFFGAWGEELFKEATAFEPQSTVADHFNGQVQPEVGIEGGLKMIYKKLVKPYNDHKIINQAHDSAILEVPKEVVDDLVPQIKQFLLRPLIIKDQEFVIPVDVEVGERWAEDMKAA